MAKAKRISVGFQPATHAALERLADAVGVSMASLVSGFMDQAAPSFDGIVEAVNLAKSKPTEALDMIQDQLVRAQHGVSKVQIELSDARAEHKHNKHNKRRAKK